MVKPGSPVASMNENSFVTVPIKDLFWCLLGDDSSGSPCTKITPNIALVLAPRLVGSHLYHLQTFDHSGKPLLLPVLWRQDDWQRSKNNYDRQKAYSEKMRVESFIRKTNEENVLKLLCNDFGFDESTGAQFAAKLVRTGSVAALKELGLKKVITKEEEL